MINRLLGYFSHDLGVDLGTANTLVYVRGKGIVINEPSFVAVHAKSKQILAIGEEAKKMVGRTPGSIVATQPLIDGVVSDFDVTEKMLRYFIEKVHRASRAVFPRPRVVVGIPSGVTEVEQRAVWDASVAAGAREAYLIEEPMAAAIGSRLPVNEANGSMIVDIGGGTTEVAVISLGGIVVSKSIKVAGDALNNDIVQYAKEEFNLHIGPRMAENIKIGIGSAYPFEKIEAAIRGRDAVTGLPKELIIDSDHVRAALAKSIHEIVDTIKLALEETPPEIIADIMDRGIYIAGGGSLLRGLDKLVAEETKMPAYVAEDPLTAVVRGCGLVVEDLDLYRSVLVANYHDKVPK